MFIEKSWNGMFTVSHNCGDLKAVLEGDEFNGNSTMFKTSLIIALLKLHYYINDSLFDDNLEVDGHKVYLKENIFDNLENADILEKVKEKYHLGGLVDLNNSQVIKDGVGILYRNLIKDGITCQNTEVGQVIITEKSITVNPIIEREYTSREIQVYMVGILCWFSNQLASKISALIDTVENDILIEGYLD